MGVVLSDSGFSGYLTINDIIPIIDNLYQNFDKSFFIEQVKKFQLPRNKRIKDPEPLKFCRRFERFAANLVDCLSVKDY